MTRDFLAGYLNKCAQGDFATGIPADNRAGASLKAEGDKLKRSLSGTGGGPTKEFAAQHGMAAKPNLKTAITGGNAAAPIPSATRPASNDVSRGVAKPTAPAAPIMGITQPPPPPPATGRSVTPPQSFNDAARSVDPSRYAIMAAPAVGSVPTQPANARA